METLSLIIAATSAYALIADISLRRGKLWFGSE
jgi:hypothetical protein